MEGVDDRKLKSEKVQKRKRKSKPDQENVCKSDGVSEWSLKVKRDRTSNCDHEKLILILKNATNIFKSRPPY